MTSQPYDAIIRNGLYFDGDGSPGAVRDVGIRDGRVAAVSETALDAVGCPQVIDAAGKWVLPGMVDIHTHYDIDPVPVAPSARKSRRPAIR